MTKQAGDKKNITEKGVLDSEIRLLMTPAAIKELKELSPTMQQFLLRFMDYSLLEHDAEHDKILSEKLKTELKEFLLEIYEQDNDAICNNIAEIVASQNKVMFDALSMQTKMIARIAEDISGIKIDITNIKERLVIMENRVQADEDRITLIEARLDKKKEKIGILETKVNGLKPELIKELIEEIEETKPVLKRLIKAQSWWNVGMRIVLAVAISTVVLLVAIQIHNNRLHYNVKNKIENIK